MSPCSTITPLSKGTTYTVLVVYNNIVQINSVLASFDIHTTFPNTLTCSATNNRKHHQLQLVHNLFMMHHQSLLFHQLQAHTIHHQILMLHHQLHYLSTTIHQ
ncbi:hypothetical protein ACTFIZ_001940 [Dictyostelium cf. discoideum]